MLVFFYIVFVAIICCKIVLSGLITPDQAIPIVPYRNNIQANGLIDFYLSLETSIISIPSITILFPSAFSPVLSSACSVQITISGTPNDNTCGLNNNLITIIIDQTKIPILESGSVKITVFNVKNPSTSFQQSGIGNFQIKTFSNGLLVDENINFGTIALANAYTYRALSSPNVPNVYAQIDNDGSTLGGFLTNYVLTFTISSYLRVNTWFRLEFPIEFPNFGNLICSLSGYPAVNLQCKMIDQVLFIKGLTIDLPSGSTNKIKLKNIYNPYMKGQTSSFIFEILEPGINTVIEFYEIMGVSIQPGLIKNPIISASPLNKNLYIDYTISFTPTNIVKEGGYFKIVFPPEFGPLAKNCRVIIGLINGVNPIKCDVPTSSYEVKIEKFATVSPQLIQIKIFATNPSVSGTPTSHFTITSYNINDKIIDENIQAGRIIVQNIDKPYFLYIEFYTMLVNTTLNTANPLDFRLYPRSINTLPATQGAKKGEILLQIPLWWRNWGIYGRLSYLWPYPAEYLGDTPICKFGSDTTSSCTFYGQKYTIKTPTIGDSKRYSTVTPAFPVGLGECDVPISIENVVVTPIPGRFDFRVLTFIDGSAVGLNTPIEQDIFTMDIPADKFLVASLYSNTKDSNDPNTILRASFNIMLKIPWEGAINFNFTIQDNLYENSAGWPVDLGFGIPEETNKVIPCRVYWNGVLGAYGYPVPTINQNVRCFVFSGKTGATPKNAILQVRGFSTDLLSGTVTVDIPDIKFCTTINMKCYVEMTTAYTTTIENPYTLNYFKDSLGNIEGPSTSFVTSPVTSPAFSVTFGPNTEICQLSTYTFTFNPTVQLNAGDHILIKVPNRHYTYGTPPTEKIAITFDRNVVGSSSGVVVTIYNFLTDEIYYLLKLNTNKGPGSSTIDLINVRNPTYHVPDDADMHFPSTNIGILIKQMFWANFRYQSVWTYPRTLSWSDGGLTVGLNYFTFMPTIDPLVVGSFDRTLDFNSWIYMKLDFITCHEIESTDSIQIVIPFNDSPLDQSYYQNVATSCNIYSGLTPQTFSLSTKIPCIRTKNYFLITGFKKVPQFTKIEVVFQVLSLKTPMTTPPYNIYSYFGLPNPALVPDTLKINDFTATTLNGIDIPGPNVFPPIISWAQFKDPKLRARVGDRGPMIFKITPTVSCNIADYTTNNNGYFLFIYDNSVVTIPYMGVLDCRVNNLLSRDCTATINGANLEIKMLMPPGNPLNSFSGLSINTEYEFIITTRGVDRSASRFEGLEYLLAGVSEVTIQCYNGATQLEYTKAIFEVYPVNLLNYWVWSASKMISSSSDSEGSDHLCDYATSALFQQCGLTFFRIYFSLPRNIPLQIIDPVTLVNVDTKPIITVEFARTNLPLFTDGFLSDLGTGLNHRNDFPCYLKNILPIPPPLPSDPVTEVSCKLYHGTKPNPTRIEIKNFNNIAAGTNIEIHIPKVFNSKSSLELVSVRVRINWLVNGIMIPQMEGNYDMINMTFSYPTPDMSSPTYIDLTLNPIYDYSFDVTSVDTLGSLTISFYSPVHQMGPGDVVVFNFPYGWQMFDPCSSNAFTGPIGSCDSYPKSNWVVLTIADLQNVIAGSVYTGTINMKTPPFTYLIPPTTGGQVKCFLYSRSKLLHKFLYPIFSQVLTPTAITTIIISASNIFSGATDVEYTIQFTIPVDIPGYAAFRITTPLQIAPKETHCKNDQVSGSLIPDLDFICDITGQEIVIKLQGTTMKANDIAVIKSIFDNPVVIGVYNWKVEIFYSVETIPPFLNKQMCVGTQNGPAIIAPTPPTPILYWENQFVTRKRVHIKEIGSIEIKVKFSTTITHNVAALQNSLYYIVIDVPQTFKPHAGAQPHATWDYEQAYYTKWVAGVGTNPGKLTVYAPRTKDIVAGTSYLLNLTTLDASDGKNGFDFPNVQGSYQFIVGLYDNTNTLVEIGYIDLFVPGVNFNKYSSSSIITNADYLTFFSIKFEPETVIPSNGYLIFYLPTQVEFTRETLFDNDLGSGLLNGDNIACDSVIDGISTKILGTLLCTLTWGSQNSGTPAQIKISGFTSALSVGVLYLLRIHNIKNPTLGSDTKHVVTRLESYDNGGTLINSGIIYDYTILSVNVPYDTTTMAGIPTPASVIDKNAGSTGVTFSLKMNSPTNLYYSNMNDYYIIEFPKPLFPIISLFTSCSLRSKCTVIYGNNWVVYKPLSASDDITANTQTSINIDNANQALYDVSTGINIIGYSVSKRIMLKKYRYDTYGPIITNSVTFTITITAPDYATVGTLFVGVPKNIFVKYLIVIPLPATATNLPAGGCIDIVFPTNFVLESTCENEVTSELTWVNPGDFSCTSGNTAHGALNYYTITGYSQIVTGKTIKILAWGSSSSAAASPSFSFFFYTDTGRTQKMYDCTATGVAVNNYPGFSILSSSNEIGGTPRVVRLNEEADFLLQISLGVSPSWIRIIFPAASLVTLPTDSFPICYFNNYEAKYCKVDTGGSLSIKIKPPNTPTLVATTMYSLKISSSCGSKAKNGLVFGADGNFAGKLERSDDGTTIADSVNFNFKVLKPDFTSAIMFMPYANAGKKCPLIVQFEPNPNVPLNGKIVITFPSKNYMRTMNLFSSNLGFTSVIQDGDTVNCYSVTTTTLQAVSGSIICRLYITVDKPYIEVSNFLAITNRVEFVIPDITIPSITTDDAYCDLLLHTEDANGNIINERVIYEVVSPQIHSISASTGGTMTSTSSAIGASTSYTFSNIYIGASATKPFTKNGRVVLSFPQTYKFIKSSVSVDIGSIEVYNNYIFYSPSSSITVGTLPNFVISNVNNPFGYDTTSIRALIVFDRNYVVDNPLTVPSWTPVSPALVVTTKISNSFCDEYADYSFSFTPSFKIPANGQVNIVFSSTILSWEFNRVKVVSGLKSSITVKNILQILKIVLGKDYSTSDGAINIIVTVKNPSTAGSLAGFQIFVYSDSDVTLIQSSSTFSFNYVSTPAVANPANSCTANIKGNILSIFHETNSATTIPISYSVQIYSLIIGGSPTGATDSGSGASLATVTATSTATDNFYSLDSTIDLDSQNIFSLSGLSGLVGESYSLLIFITDSGQTSFYEKCGLVHAVIGNSQDFTSPTLINGHSDQNLMSYIEINAIAPFSISTTSHGISISFSNNYGFDLGNLFEHGSDIPCYSSADPNLVCKFSSKQNNFNGISKIYLTNFNNIAAGAAIQLFIYRIINPSAGRNNEITLNVYDIVTNPLLEISLAHHSFNFEIYVSTASTSTLTVAASTIQTTIAGPETLSLSTSGNYRIFYLSLENKMIPDLITPTFSNGLCSWHAKGRMAFCGTGTGAGGFTNTISNFKSSLHISTSNNIGWIGYVTDTTTNKLLYLKNFVSPASIGQFSNVIVKVLDSTAGAARFYFGMTPNNEIPKYGCIEIDLSSFSTVSFTSLTVVGGNYEGKIAAKIVGKILYATNFDVIHAGTNIALIFILTVTPTTGTVNAIKITSYAFDYKTASFQDYKIEEKTALSVILGTSVAVITCFCPTNYIISYLSLQKAQNSFISFNIMLNAALGTQALRFHPLNAWNIAGLTSRLRCRFSNIKDILTQSYSSRNCYITTDEHIVVQSPVSAVISATDVYRVSIFFAESDSQAGFPIKGVEAEAAFSVSLTASTLDIIPTAGNLLQRSIALLKIFTSASQSGCILSVLNNAADINTLHYEIKLQSTANSIMEVMLPTTRKWDSSTSDTLFDLKLGTSKNNMDDFYCKFGTAFTGFPKCILIYGTSERPVTLRIIGFNAIAAGTLIIFDVINLKNPTATDVYTDSYFYTYSIVGSTKKPIDFFYFPYVVYTSTSTPTTSSQVFPTLSSLVVNTVVTASISVTTAPVITLESFDGVLLNFDAIFDPTKLLTSAVTGKTTLNIYQSEITAGIFVILSLTQTKTVPASLIFSNLKNPSTGGTYANSALWIAYLIVDKLKYHKITFTSPPTFVGGTFVVLSQPIKLTTSPATPLIPEVPRDNSITLIIEFKNMFLWVTNTDIKITFPTGFNTFSAGSPLISTGTAAFSVVGQVVTVRLTSGNIVEATSITLKINVKSPTTFGYTVPFIFEYYDSSNIVVASKTDVQGVEIVGIKIDHILGLTVWRFAQANDFAPIYVKVTLASTLIKDRDYITFVSQTSLWLPVTVPGSEYDDLKCFWNNLAAKLCEPIIAGNGFKVYAPVETNLNSGSDYWLYIGTNRVPTNLNLKENFQIINIADTYKIDFTPFVNSVGQTIILKHLIILSETFIGGYITNHMTTINSQSILKVYLETTKTIPSESSVTPGHILIEFPNNDILNEVQYLPDLGTSLTNGSPIDCLCEEVTCPAPTDVTCSLNLGSGRFLSPTFILIKFKFQINFPTKFTWRFPKLTNPTPEKLFVKMRVMSRKFNTISKVFDILNELPNQDIFYTTKNTLSINANNAPNPTFSPNLVGEPGDVTFKFNQNIADLISGISDRYIIECNTPEMIFELPPATYRTNVYVIKADNQGVLNNGIIRLYPLAKWLEIEPVLLTDLNWVKGSQSLRIRNFKNVPYIIAGGINFVVYTWISLDLQLKTTFPNLPIALANNFYDFPVGKKTYTPFDVIIQQPTRYSFTFQPYNRIPLNGMIYIEVPTCANCIFKSLDPYCIISGGINDASCDVITTGTDQIVRMEIKGFGVIYDPFPPKNDPDITVQFYAQNPMVNTGVPGTTYFKVTTFYNNLDLTTIMDQDLQYDSGAIRFVCNGGNILKASINELYRLQHPLCAGMIGPLELTFQMNPESLVYPTDYVKINFYNSFTYTISITDELICYFDELSIPERIKFKSFRCEWDVATTTLTAYIPEELTPFTFPVSGVKTYKLTIYGRVGLGLVATNPSAIYWAQITTSKSIDSAWTEIQIPACPFDGSYIELWDYRNVPITPICTAPPGPHCYGDCPITAICTAPQGRHCYDCPITTDIFYYEKTTWYPESLSWEASKSPTDPTWTAINLTLTTTVNNIPTGDINTQMNSRILVEFITHNELDPVFSETLGVITPPSTISEIGCAGQHYNKVSPLNIPPGVTTPNYVFCTVIGGLPGTSVTSTQPTIPTTVMFQNYEPITANSKFNLQITKIANPIKTSTFPLFSHIVVRVQSMQKDGTYYDIYYHEIFHLVTNYLSSPNSGGGQAGFPSLPVSSISVNRYYRRVDRNINNSTYEFQGNIDLKIGDRVVFEHNYPYQIGPRAFCVQFRNPGSYYNPNLRPFIGCAANRFSGWFATHVTVDVNYGSGHTYKFTELASFKNPPYETKDTSGVNNNPFRVYVFQNGKLIEYCKTEESPDRAGLVLTLETPEAENDVDKIINYKLGFYLGTATTYLNYIRITAPKSFQTIDDPCIIRRGLVLVDIGNPNDPIRCKVTDNTVDYTIEINNFGTYLGDGWLIIELKMKNPSTPVWTDLWSATTYHSQPPTLTQPLSVYDQTKIIDRTGGDARTWVGKKPFPNLFRVYRNTKSYQDRLAKDGQYAEMNVRLIPKTVMPPTAASTSAWVEVWLPNDYDLPNGGTAVCQMGQNYHTDLEGQYCKIDSSRKISMNTNTNTGLNAPCSLLTLTTINAIGSNGIKVPVDPGSSSLQFYQYINNNLVEYSTPGIITMPHPITIFTTFSTIRECCLKSVFRIKFETNIDIPAGYDTSVGIIDPLLKNPIGYLQYLFNTWDLWTFGLQGYPCDLGYSPNTDLPCRPMQGLIPKDGETIKCTIIYAKCKTPPIVYSIFDPVIVKVTNFKKIDIGTMIEIHFLEVNTVSSNTLWGNYNNGRIEIAGFQDNADGTVTELIQKTERLITFTLKNPTIPDPLTYTYDCNIYPAFVTISPNNYVGRYIIMDLEFDLAANINAGGNIVLTFPSQFELKYQKDSEIQAAIDGIFLKTIIYAIGSVNKIYFEIPAGATVAVNPPLAPLKKVRISQIRNMANTPAALVYDNLYLQIISNNQFRIQENEYINIPSPTAGPFSSKILTLSSYFAGDVNVLYKFTVSTTYRIPIGSIITILFPNYDPILFPQYAGLSYTHLPNSNPLAVSSTSPTGLMDNGVISSNKVVITTVDLIPESTSIELSIKGAKNPDYTGITGSTDFLISVKNSALFEIFSDIFSPITFLSKKTPDVLYMQIKASNLYQSVSTDYVFALQVSNAVPNQGKIYLKFPPEWASETIGNNPSFSISDLTGSFTGNKLIYTQIYDPTTSQLIITPGFDWPAHSSLYVSMNGLINPKLITKTTVFGVKTEYDGVTLDKSDSEDSGLILSFKKYLPSLNLVTEPIISPKNEGEISSYIMNFTNTETIPPGATMSLDFSSNYDNLLSTYDKGITCSSIALGTVPCTVSNGKVVVNFPNGVPKNVYFDLTVNGIMNPNSGSTGTMDIILNKGEEILSYTNKAARDIKTTSAPKFLNLTYLNSTSRNLQEKSNYTFCVATSDPISLTSSILIEFPKQFSLRQNSYSCEITDQNNALIYGKNDTSPKCEINNLLRTISITGHVAAFAGSAEKKQLCYKIINVENPSESGESSPFVVSIFDQEKNEIQSKTYGNMNYPSTITYFRSGLRIVIGNIGTIYVGTMSISISATLERSVSYEIHLTPISDGFEFEPKIISFYSYLPSKLYFKIRPLTGAKLGQNKISWTKKENTTSPKFSEVADSFFILAQYPAYKELKLIISPVISRTALLGTSLPIKVQLSVPPANNLTLYYKSYRPDQAESIIFTPDKLVFQPGETTKSFTYTTKRDAVSGQILFNLEEQYATKYYMTTNLVNFEILDIDVYAPKLINYYIMDMDRTYMYFRISASESSWTYYILSLKGTSEPPFDEIINPALRVSRKSKTHVMELYGANFSYQSPVTKEYIYYDTYLLFTGLEEQTDYILYFLIMDLSQNYVEKVKFPFTTLKKHYPAKFFIKLNEDVVLSRLFNAFGLITGLQPERFKVDNAPLKFKIPETDEKIVQNLLESQTTTYEFTLLQNITENGIRPIEKIWAIEKYKDILYSEIPELVYNFAISQSSYEILAFKQELSYIPLILIIGQDSVVFNISIKRNGTLYGIVMEKETARPNARQMKYGKSSTNFNLTSPNFYFAVKFEYGNALPTGYIISKTATFSDLYDNTEYDAYFVGENDLPVNPDLMDDDDIVKVSFITQSEIFVLPQNYQKGLLIIFKDILAIFAIVYMTIIF